MQYKELLSKIKSHWLYTMLVFSFVYGFLLNFIFAVLFSASFGILEIFAFGFAYYFFRFELFAWLRGVKE